MYSLSCAGEITHYYIRRGTVTRSSLARWWPSSCTKIKYLGLPIESSTRQAQVLRTSTSTSIPNVLIWINFQNSWVWNTDTSHNEQTKAQDFITNISADLEQFQLKIIEKRTSESSSPSPGVAKLWLFQPLIAALYWISIDTLDILFPALTSCLSHYETMRFI